MQTCGQCHDTEFIQSHAFHSDLGLSDYLENGGLSSSSDGQIQNYAEDTPDKLPRVLSWLDEADYLVMSSNRLYASIPRLPLPPRFWAR